MSSKFLDASNDQRGRSSSFVEKLTSKWHCKSREPSRHRPQREQDSTSKSPEQNVTAFVQNKHASIVVSSTSTDTTSAVVERTVITSAVTESNLPVVPKTQKVDENARPDGSVAKRNLDQIGFTDMWSAAYHEAVLDLGEEVEGVILKGENIETLLRNLERASDEAVGDSIFWRGVRRLQTPLKNFKLALDLASPLASIQPAASTAVGIVSCVTAIAIGICGAEDSFKSGIISVLERIPIIDDCDTLGQKVDTENGIHRALVPVYKDLLNFYVAAHHILTSDAFRLALICEKLRDRLPKIVEDFVTHAGLLRDTIQTATSLLVADIQKLLQDNKIQKLLGVDKDEQRSKFHADLRDLRASDACEWIISDFKFREWYDSPSSKQLILFGYMGCGKTVVTAHVIEELIRQSEHQFPHPFICYHYCLKNERGTALYVFSSLILQLLDQQRRLKVEFDKWYERTREAGRLDPAQSSVDLGKFISACVESLDRELFIVIDALDECDSGSQNEILALLGSLSKQTQRFKVFISSRPQNGIEDLLPEATAIRWSPSRQRDAKIVKHRVQKSLSGLSANVQLLVTERLSEMARGSAIWVKLTIDLIYTRRIKAMGPMRNFLEHTPSPAELWKLYAELFNKQTGGDPDNEELVTNALEVLAVARRDLSMLELAWAMALRDSSTTVSTVEGLKDYVDSERVLSLLQPFLFQLDFEEVQKRQVRLVHASLTELVQLAAPSGWSQSQNPAKDSDINKRSTQQRMLRLEAALLCTCVKYLLLDEIDQIDLLSEEQEGIITFEALPGFGAYDDSFDVAQDPDSAWVGQGLDNEQDAKNNYYDPAERGFGGFYVYASCFWVDHFTMSDPDHLPDMVDIVKLCSASSERRLKNWIRQKYRPDCTITPQFMDNYLHDPLTVVSLHGPETTLKRLLQDDAISLRGKEFLSGTVEEATQRIIYEGDLSRLIIFFHDARVGPQIRHIGTFHRMMIRWAQQSEKQLRPWASCFDLVFNICDDVLVNEKQGNELLCLAARCGCLPVVERLFEAAARNPALRDEILREVRRDVRPPDYHQSVGEAVRYDSVDVLRYLLDQEGIEGHLRHRDSKGYNVLHWAAFCCNPEVISLLISVFPEGVNESNDDGTQPLHLVVFNRHPQRLEAAVILLTEGHADVEKGSMEEPSSWDDPLRMAARYGDLEMCRVLVEVGGANPRRVLKFEDGSPRLMDSTDFPEMAPQVLETLCSLAGIAS